MFKYKIGQVIENKNIGKVRIYNRWHGKNEDFYDVEVLSPKKTWTYSEFEMLHGYSIRNPHLS